MEIWALEEHIGVDKNGGLSSLLLETGEKGLHDGAGFMSGRHGSVSRPAAMGRR